MEELIFTSSSRGLQVGKSGFCTVAATAGMTPGLIRMLESLSGYRHLFAPGTPEAKKNPIAYSYVKAKVGNDFRYVLSRVKDCGVDYSGRSNKIAHHLSLQSNLQASSPTRTLLEKKFFVDQWEKPAANLPPRELPGKYSKPSPCSYWQKVTGDAGWAGELIESCQMNKVVYLIVKPSTPVMGLIHQAISLLPADQQWQYTFCTFYRQMPPNVDCQIRCVMQNSPEIELTRQSSNNVLIDLTKPLGKSLSHWAENARTGTLIEGQRPVVDPLPTTADINRQRVSRPTLPSAMPDLRSSAKKGPPGLQQREKPPEEELDVLEIEPTPLWKRALVASLVALVLAGIASVVVYPDMYKGLFSTSFFNFNSGPSVSRFASERPDNAPPPKPKLNSEPIDDNNVSVASGEESPEETIDVQGSEQKGTDTLVEQGDNPAPDPVSVAETPKRPRADRTGNREVKPAMTPRSNGGRNRRGFQSERPGVQRQPIPRRPTVSVPAIPEAPATAADAAVAVNPSEESPTELIPEPAPVQQTLVRIDSLEAVSFSPKWDLIEPSRAPIPVVVATHARQSEMGIKFDLQPSLEHSSTAPAVNILQISPRRWDVTIAGRATGYFQLVDSSAGTRLEFQCNLDDNGNVDALTDDIDFINRCQIRIEYADNIATVFPLDIKFVRGHIGLDNKRRNNDVKFAFVADMLNELLESEALELLYDVHGFSTADSVRWNSFGETSQQTEQITGRDRDKDAAEDEVQETPHTQIDFKLDLSETAFDGFSPDQVARLEELNPRLRLVIYKPERKPLRYLWHRFIVDAPGYPNVELKSWKFANHPLSVIRRDYTKRKSALKAAGGSPQPARPGAGQVPEGGEQLIDIVTAEIDFLDEVHKKTARTLQIDELMPGRVPHPIEIRSDGLLMLMYIDMGDIGKQWSIADMKQAYHGSPIE